MYWTFDEEYDSNPNWPLEANKENMWLALDLYSLSIVSAKDAIKNSDDFMEFIIKFLVPTLQIYLKEINDYKFGVKLLRLFNIIVQNLQVGLFPLLEFMTTTFELSEWVQRVSFELFNDLFTNSYIVSIILPDKEMLNFLEIWLVSIQKYLETNKFVSIEEEFTGQKPFPKYLDNRVNESDKPSLKVKEIMSLSIETITGLADAISSILFPQGFNNSDAISSYSLETDEHDITIPYSVSNLILRIISVLIDKTNTDVNVQSLLNSIQNYINISGSK